MDIKRFRMRIDEIVEPSSWLSVSRVVPRLGPIFDDLKYKMVNAFIILLACRLQVFSEMGQQLRGARLLRTLQLHLYGNK